MKHVLRLVAAGIICTLPVIGHGSVLRNLKIGDSGQDVRELQQILNRDPETRVAASGAGSPGNETTYFGSLTFDAIKRFQQKYASEILAPIGLSAPTGFVGTRTRVALARLASGGNPPPGTPPPPQARAPSIISISPSVVTQATQVLTITGSNFTPVGNSVLVSSEPLNAFTNLSSSEGKTITFTFHLSAADTFRRVLAPFKTKGNYAAVAAAVAKNVKERIPGVADSEVPVKIVVTNAHGQSTQAQLLINMTKIFDEIGNSTP